MILNDICEVYSGYALKKFNENGDGLPVIKIGNILADGTLQLEDCEYTIEKVHDKYYSKKEDIYVALSGATTGKIGINKSDKKYIINQRVGIVRKKDNNIPNEFIKFFLLRQTERILQEAAGCAQPNISPKQIAQYALPDIRSEKMRQIVVVLNRLTSVIVSRKTELQKLDDLIKARFVEMFGDEKNLKPMSELCLIITDGTHQPPKFQDTGIPFIFVSNITGDKVTYDTEKFIDQNTYDELIKRTPIEIGDVLLSTVGSYGHPAVVKSDKKFLFQRHIAYLKPRREIIDSDYLHGAILSPDAQRQIEEGVKGIAQKTLNLSEIKKMRIPIPNMNEQKEFAAFVDQVDKSKVVVQKALDEVQVLFDSLMQQYFG